MLCGLTHVVGVLRYAASVEALCRTCVYYLTRLVCSNQRYSHVVKEKKCIFSITHSEFKKKITIVGVETRSSPRASDAPSTEHVTTRRDEAAPKVSARATLFLATGRHFHKTHNDQRACEWRRRRAPHPLWAGGQIW